MRATYIDWGSTASPSWDIKGRSLPTKRSRATMHKTERGHNWVFYIMATDTTSDIRGKL